MLKVLINMNLGNRLGGSEEMLWQFLSHLDRDAVDPVCIVGPGTLGEAIAALGIPIATLDDVRPGNVPAVLRQAAFVRRTIRSERPDVVLHWLMRAQLHGGIAVLGSRAARRSAWFQHDFLQDAAYDRAARLLPAAAVFCCSDAVAAEQAARWPLRACVTVHPGIDPPARVDPAEVADLRDRLGIPPGRRVVGIVGRLIEWKGQHALIDALAVLRRTGLDVHGLVVGSADDTTPHYADYLVGLTTALGLEDAVTFTGQVADSLPYFALMDVNVNASIREPFGIVLLEAMALGVPSVGVDGGPKEIIEDGVSGLLVASNEAPDLAATIRSLLENDDLHARIAAASPSRAAAFSARRMTDRLTEQLQAIALGRTPACGVVRAPEPSRP